MKVSIIGIGSVGAAVAFYADAEDLLHILPVVVEGPA